VERIVIEPKRRPTLHLARASDAMTIARLDHESEQHYASRCESIRALGERWVRHPNYRFTPLHSMNPEVWKPAHAEFWARVHADAAAARDLNPAFGRAQRVRAAVEGFPLNP
jgi:hypothetical protein